MTVRVFFLVSGLLYLVMGARLGATGVLMSWLGVSLLIVGIAYSLGRPGLFGKRPDGTFHPLALALLGPYLFTAWAAWRYRQRNGEAPSNEVAPGIWVGRMASPDELPKGTALVVDLTCELWPPGVVRRGNYRCLPTLDGTAPEPIAFRALVQEVAAVSGPVFIHCAAGRGRSATLAAAVMIARGLAPDAETAERLMQEKRPQVKLGRQQRALLGRR